MMGCILDLECAVHDSTAFSTCVPRFPYKLLDLRTLSIHIGEEDLQQLLLAALSAASSDAEVQLLARERGQHLHAGGFQALKQILISCSAAEA